MKAVTQYRAPLIALPLILTQTLIAQTLALRGTRAELTWPAALTNAQSAVVYPEYSIYSSRDLKQWTRAPGTFRGVPGRSGPLFSLSLDQAAPDSGAGFYRIDVDARRETLAANSMLGEAGAEVLGYQKQFAAELEALGQISLADFAVNAPQPDYLPALTWDVTTAQFWTNFNAPADFTMHYGGNFSGINISYNFRPDPAEFEILRTNGFVVSERMGSPTFGDAYYRIYNADLPVFVTSDSVLHAWHKSYQSILAELEELGTATLLERMLTSMAAPLPSLWAFYGQGPLSNSIVDADYFLTVARSLWAGQQVSTSLKIPEQEQLVTRTLTAVSNLTLEPFPLFGKERVVDFSQFKVRGHYDTSDRMRRYFRTMMWLGRTDLRLATFEPNKEDDIRQFGTAIVLKELLQASGQWSTWAAIEKVVNLFVGLTDSMTFSQLDELLLASGIWTLEEVPDLLTLTNLQTALMTGELGAQNIHSDYLVSPLSPEQVRLPRSFTVSGQKFVLDSWAFSQVVFDRVLWEPSDPPRIIETKVIRRKPTCLDVAYAVLGNDQVVPELVALMNNRNGVVFRDGLPYQHNLLAVRKTIDAQAPSTWGENIYLAWLSALRSLSAPTTDPNYPEAMRTRAWAMKTLNTQLASWTELRHDTLLYAKQSYTEPLLCSYPAGFVEPRPEFWRKMQALADITAAAVRSLPLSGTVTLNGSSSYSSTFDLAQVKTNQVNFLKRFSERAVALETIAAKELGQQPLSAIETQMLQDVIELSVDYVGQKRWTGWYPAMFYTNSLALLQTYSGYAEPSPACDAWDALVADVHTDLPDDYVGDPGAVIHEGVGHVNMMLIAIDNGPDRMMYVGPVLSHYEFELPGVQRWSDADWKATVRAGQQPPVPVWTRSYLVPGRFPMPPGYD